MSLQQYLNTIEMRIKNDGEQHRVRLTTKDCSDDTESKKHCVPVDQTKSEYHLLNSAPAEPREAETKRGYRSSASYGDVIGKESELRNGECR